MDELYVLARRVLLDALEALGEHRHATILVGAQAVYLHTGSVNLGVAEYTTDADLAIDPSVLGRIPPLEEALERRGFFVSTNEVGIWRTHRTNSSNHDVEVQVDLLVPSTMSPGTGRRAARLPGHVDTAARKVDGLEGVLVDNSEHDLGSLEPDVDARIVRAKVAGPGALLAAKMFKIAERRGSSRSNDKDALDVLRILQAVPTSELLRRFRSMLADARSADSSRKALRLFDDFFGTRGSEGALMAARATQLLLDEDEVRRTCAFLAADLIAALGLK